MIPTEVVGTPHQIHPGGQHRFGVGDGASSACQRSQGAAKGGIEPLDIGGVDNGSARGSEHLGNGRGSPSHHAVHNLDYATPGIGLDDLADEQARLHH